MFQLAAWRDHPECNTGKENQNRTCGILEVRIESSETGETKVAVIHEAENHKEENSRDLQ